jgi:hypothetical protein
MATGIARRHFSFSTVSFLKSVLHYLGSGGNTLCGIRKYFRYFPSHNRKSPLAEGLLHFYVVLHVVKEGTITPKYPSVILGRMDMYASCHCGGVKIKTDRDAIPGIVKCYCFDCQKLLGNFAPWVVCDKSKTEITGSVGTYQSSESIERLFCTHCGSSLAKKPATGEKILIVAGVFSQPIELEVINEVFTEDKQLWM